jgi:hypothetical protein
VDLIRGSTPWQRKTEALSFLLAMGRTEWRERAACRDSELDFVPEETGWTEARSGPGRIYRLLEVCSGCPVRRECLSWALELTENTTTHEVLGILGGTLTREREKALETLGAAPAAADALGATFRERLAWWRKRATRPCKRCAEPMLAPPVGAVHCPPCRATIKEAAKERGKAKAREREAEKGRPNTEAAS